MILPDKEGNLKKSEIDENYAWQYEGIVKDEVSN